MGSWKMAGRRALLGLTVAAGMLGAAAAAASADSFDTYTGSAPLSSYKPGAVLNTRTVTYHFTGISVPITAVQLLYRTTGAQGQPTANVTTVLQPIVKTGAQKVVAYQSFYDTLNPADEPSAVIAGGTSFGGTIWDSETTLISDLLLDGTTVVISDTEGQTADFAAGPEYGMDTLDSIRAAWNSSTAAVSSTAPVAMLGYSGGAIATGWASLLAPTYAPDVNKQLVGAAEGGILVDPAHNLNYVSGSTVWAGVIPMAIIGIARAYGIDLEQYMNSYGKSLYTKLQNASIAQVLGTYSGLTWQKLVQPQYDNPDSIADFVNTVNKLDMGSFGSPTIPMFMGQGNGGTLEGTPVGGSGIGPGDGVMIAGDVRTLARQYCGSGDAVDYQEYSTSHFTSVPEFLAQAEPWLLDRLAGKAAPNDCSTIAAGNSLAPQTVVGGDGTTSSSQTASLTVAQHGSVQQLTVKLPSPAARFTFRWQHGVSFGVRRTRAQITKEIALDALPSHKAAAIKVVSLPKALGQVTFKLASGSLSQFTFQLNAHHLWYSPKVKAAIAAHRIKTVSGVFSVRTAAGKTYRKTLKVKV